MLTHQQFMEEMLEFTSWEKKFKKLHEQIAEEDIKGDFEQDYNEFMNNSSLINPAKKGQYWYSSLADFRYPRVMGNSKTRICKNGRYHLPFLHVHSIHEFFYVYSGQCYHTINNEQSVLEAGTFYYIAPGEVHSIYSNTDDAIVINLIVTPETMEKVLHLFAGEENVFGENISADVNTSPCSCIFIKDKNEVIKEIVENLYRMYCDNEEIAELFMVSALTEIFAFCLAEKLTVNVTKRNSNISLLVFEMLEYIKNNFQKVTLERLSNHFKISPQYISRIIRRETGKTFKEIVNGIKVGKAKGLLLTTNLRVIDIAYEVGFNSSEHFIRTFKEYTKLKPMEFRKNKKHQ